MLIRRVALAATATLMLLALAGGIAYADSKNNCPPTSNNPDGRAPDCGNQHPGKTANRVIDAGQAEVLRLTFASLDVLNASIDTAQFTAETLLVTAPLVIVNETVDSTQSGIFSVYNAAIGAAPIPPPPVCDTGLCRLLDDAEANVVYPALVEASTGIDDGQDAAIGAAPIPPPPVCDGGLCRDTLENGETVINEAQVLLTGSVIDGAHSVNSLVDSAQ